ncbi:MAG: hypothetical protein AB7S68_29720 [Polyangiaceae bacterium]
MNDPSPLLGRYRFQQSLASAGKSVCWIARDEETGQRVVIGSLPIPRARTLVPLVGYDNPHLARVHHVLDDADPRQLPRGVDLSTQALVVAEHISGRTLHQRVETASIPVPRAVNWIMRLARTLKEIHGRLAVLGAISPRSVVVVRDGVVPVFTHLMAPPSGAFCSPPRVQGGGPSPEDDVWALTCLLYLAVARAQPFRGGSRDALAQSILNADFAPLGSRGVEDANLDAIIRTGFQLDGSGQTAAELELALVEWIRRGADVHEPRVSTRPPPPVSADPAFPPGTQAAARPPSTTARAPSTAPRATSPAPRRPSAAPHARASEPAAPPRMEPVRAPLERYAPISFTDEATAPALPTDIQRLAQAARPSSEMPAVAAPATAPPAATPMAPMGNAPVNAPPEAWDDHTAPALPSDIRQLAEAHAALAAGEKALKDASRSAEHPRFESAPGEETSPDIPSARAPYSFEDAEEKSPVPSIRSGYTQSDAEEETGRFTADDLHELRLMPPAPGATNAGELPESGRPPQPEPDLHPPTIVINEQAEQFRRRMDTLPPSGQISQADIATQIMRAAKPASRTAPALLMRLLAALVAAGTIALLLMRSKAAPVTSPVGTVTATEAQPPEPPKSASLPTPASAPIATATDLASTTDSPADVVSCAAAHFPEGTFAAGEPNLATLCTDRDPRRLTRELHRRIVVGGQGQISAGMREWSLLSWYELAALATIQLDCCPEAKIELPEAPVCEPLSKSLTRVAREKDDASIDNLERQIACLYERQAPRPYRYVNRPDSGNKTALKQFLERARKR